MHKALQYLIDPQCLFIEAIQKNLGTILLLSSNSSPYLFIG
jgi:hypothetical protein